MIVKWAQEDVEILCNLLNKYINNEKYLDGNDCGLYKVLSITMPAMDH